MADGMTIDMERDDVLEKMGQLGDVAGPFVKAAAKVTVDLIVTDMRARLTRQLRGDDQATTSRPDLGHNLTVEGIQAVESGPIGYEVIAARNPFMNLPLWIEKGTQRHIPGGHSSAARPFFYVSAELEEGAHLDRIEDALTDAIDAVGLGQ